ncbi:MAG: rhodanese-like domain-containing protein [Gemmatimonadales bacterium]|nr:MAG: rhodanese-like domain-containing protein [Gemmatimonadales bacterium]
MSLRKPAVATSSWWPLARRGGDPGAGRSTRRGRTLPAGRKARDIVNALLIQAAGAAVLLVLKIALGRGGDVRGEETRRLIAGGALLLDVRTSREFATGHLPGATNIPLGDLERRMHSLGPKDRPIIAYCQSGQRSGLAKRQLTANGFTAVRNLGAMSSW